MLVSEGKAKHWVTCSRLDVYYMIGQMDLMMDHAR